MADDAQLLKLGLEVDAAIVADLTLRGRPGDADAHIETTRYRERFEAWKHHPERGDTSDV